MRLYTIGHSNHSVERLTNLLNDNGVMTLVDVRTSPYSRYNPQFNKESLEFQLPRVNIQYIYAGKHLGGRPSDPTCYKHGRLPDEGSNYLHEVDYPKVMKRTWFIQGIKHLLEIMDQDLTAIMCSEEDPNECHRHHLISKYILEKYPEIDIRHIRGDGTMYSAKSILTSVDKEDAEQLPLF